jgi:23S rRNA G2069 N7-methylase RlmK/C1962 C5-methylase RlmI
MNKKILDVCCGGKMFWFEKNHQNALYLDRRVVEQMTVGKGKNKRNYECNPDVVMDFRNLEIENEVFNLVVFDPPHFIRAGSKSYMAQKYGVLNKETWKEDISKGFSECFRVLKIGGVLIFKWNEYHIPLSDILKCTDQKPLFGHKSGKSSKTHWITFMKFENLNP